MSIDPSEDQVKAGRIVAGCLSMSRQLCKKEIRSINLDREIEKYILDNGGKPSLKGFQPSFSKIPYAHATCISINNEAVHGVPDDRIILPSDVITIDLVVDYNGWHADAARTFTYSDNKKINEFIAISKCVFDGVIRGSVIPQARVNIYSQNMLTMAQMMNIVVVDEFCGHGIGTMIHDEPLVYNSPEPSCCGVFEIGKSYAIEPIFADRPYTIKMGDNHWTYIADTLTAHFENTYFIKEDGIINLTEEDNG